MNAMKIYMTMIAFIGSFLYYVQAYKIFTIKSAKDVSALGFSISLFTSTNWFLYGIVMKDYPVIFSGALNIVGAGLVVLGTICYRKKNPVNNSKN